MYCRIHLPIVPDVFKDHLVNQEKDEVEYFFTFSITSTGNRLLIYLNGISINILEIVHVNV